VEKFYLISRIIISGKQINYINERGILLTIEKIRRDLKPCAKRLNRALRDLEKALDERPDFQRFDGGGGMTAQKVRHTHFRLNPIKRSNMQADRMRWLTRVALNNQAAIDAYKVDRREHRHM